MIYLGHLFIAIGLLLTILSVPKTYKPDGSGLYSGITETNDGKRFVSFDISSVPKDSQILSVKFVNDGVENPQIEIFSKDISKEKNR